MRALIYVLFLISLATPWVIYKRNHKKKLVCKEETEWGNSTVVEDGIELSGKRNTRDIAIDPDLHQPIIFLGVKPNDSKFIDDGDFEIVSDQLSKEELQQVKKRIMETCNALNSN